MRKLFAGHRTGLGLGAKIDIKENRDNYWLIDKTENGWSEPKPISEAISRMTVRWQMSVSKNGTLYFGSTDSGGRGASDIYCSRFIDGEYSKVILYEDH